MAIAGRWWIGAARRTALRPPSRPRNLRTAPLEQKTGLEPATSTRTVGATSERGLRVIGPHDRLDEAAERRPHAPAPDGLRPPVRGGLIDILLRPSSYRFDAICCAVSIIAASIGLISWK